MSHFFECRRRGDPVVTPGARWAWVWPLCIKNKTPADVQYRFPPPGSAAVKDTTTTWPRFKWHSRSSRLFCQAVDVFTARCHWNSTAVITVQFVCIINRNSGTRSSENPPVTTNLPGNKSSLFTVQLFWETLQDGRNMNVLLLRMSRWGTTLHTHTVCVHV